MISKEDREFFENLNEKVRRDSNRISELKGSLKTIESSLVNLGTNSKDASKELNKLSIQLKKLEEEIKATKISMEKLYGSKINR